MCETVLPGGKRDITPWNGGSKPPPYGVRFICLPVGTPLPGRPEKAAFGTMSPGRASGMMRWFPRWADDICPYGA